jgi:glycine C-acetyltransferase
MGKLEFMSVELARLRGEGLFNPFRMVTSPQGAWIEADGKRVLNLCSNNYLGFGNDPRLVAAAHRALDSRGVGPCAVRPLAGTMDLHVELEEKLARFKGAEAALSFQSGYSANVGVIPAVADAADDLILTDELNHASIIDGVRQTKARRVIYRHNDIQDLRAKLREGRGARRTLIVTDGVFSMDGDIAPLPELVEAAEEVGAIVMVDDAHGEGVLGSHGRGIVDHFGLHGRVDIEVGTLSKAFGVVGGFAAGSRLAMEFLRQKARAFTFSSAATPPDVAACIAAIDILTETDAPVRRLWENGDALKEGFQRAGFDIGHSRTPITPVILGEAETAREFSRRLYDAQDVFAQAIAFPIVPRGAARIRCMVSAAHSPEDIRRAVEAFCAVGKDLGVVG